TLSVDVPPGETAGADVPAQDVAVPPAGLEHILKSCGIVPLSLILNVTVPTGTDFTDSWNLYSEGFPATTFTVVAFPAARCAVAAIAQPAGATAARPAA